MRWNTAKEYLCEKHGVKTNFAVSSDMRMEHTVMLLEQIKKLLIDTY